MLCEQWFMLSSLPQSVWEPRTQPVRLKKISSVILFLERNTNYGGWTEQVVPCGLNAGIKCIIKCTWTLWVNLLKRFYYWNSVQAFSIVGNLFGFFSLLTEPLTKVKLHCGWMDLVASLEAEFSYKSSSPTQLVCVCETAGDNLLGAHQLTRFSRSLFLSLTPPS